MRGRKTHSVGVKFDGDAKGFKSAAEDAKRATENLKKDIQKKSKESSTSFESIGKAVLAVGAALGTVRIAFGTFQKVMMSAQSTGDALTHQLNGIKGASTALMQNLATADFSSSLWDAFYAARELSAALDDLGDRTLSVNILAAAGQSQMSELRRIVRDTTKSEQERLEAAEKIEKIATRELKNRQQLAMTNLTALIKEQTKKNNLTEQEGAMIFSYIANYSRFTKAQHDFLSEYIQAKQTVEILEKNQLHHNESLRRPKEHLVEAEKRLLAITQQVPEELLKYADIFSTINKLTDDQRKAIADIAIQWYGAGKAYNDYMAGIDRTANRLRGDSPKPGAIDREPPLPAIGSIMQGFDPSSVGLQHMRVTYFAEQIEYSTKLVSELEGVFADLFSSIEGGADAMAEAFINAIRRMAIEALAKMAVFALLNALTGGTGSLAKWASQMLGGANPMSMGQFMGFKMAEGGIVSAPTLAQIGEYPGAGTNPEVVAPLNKLKSLMGEGGNYRLTGKLHGRDIFIAAERYANTVSSNT